MGEQYADAHAVECAVDRERDKLRDLSAVALRTAPSDDIFLPRYWAQRGGHDRPWRVSQLHDGGHDHVDRRSKHWNERSHGSHIQFRGIAWSGESPWHGNICFVRMG